MYNTRAVLRLLPIMEVLASIIDTKVNVDVAIHNNQCQQTINRASTERQLSVNRPPIEHQQSVNRVSTEHQQSINNLGCCILYDSRAVLRHLPIINIVAAFVGKRERDKVTAPVQK